MNKESPYNDHIKTYEDLKYEFEKFLPNTLDGKLCIAIDEIQEIEGWEKFINGYLSIFQERVEVFITGSNSFLVSGELATYLTGRYVEFPIYPLSFSEFCSFKKEGKSKENFMEYLKYGGLPAIFKMEYTPETIFPYLLSVYHTIVLRDIISHHQIRHVTFLRDLYKYVLANIGNIFSRKSIKDYFQSQTIAIGNDTVLGFLGYAEETFLLHKVYSVHPETKKYFEIYNKYYAGDIGLRNALVGYDWRRDASKLIENYVFLELRRHGYEVIIGRFDDNREIDFIASKQGITKYFQVAYLLASEETITREYTSLEAIPDNWEKYVVSMDDINLGISGGIKHIHVMEIEGIL